MSKRNPTPEEKSLIRKRRKQNKKEKYQDNEGINPVELLNYNVEHIHKDSYNSEFIKSFTYVLNEIWYCMAATEEELSALIESFDKHRKVILHEITSMDIDDALYFKDVMDVLIICIERIKYYLKNSKVINKAIYKNCSIFLEEKIDKINKKSKYIIKF